MWSMLWLWSSWWQWSVLSKMNLNDLDNIHYGLGAQVSGDGSFYISFHSWKIVYKRLMGLVSGSASCKDHLPLIHPHVNESLLYQLCLEGNTVGREILGSQNILFLTSICPILGCSPTVIGVIDTGWPATTSVCDSNIGIVLNVPRGPPTQRTPKNQQPVGPRCYSSGQYPRSGPPKWRGNYPGSGSAPPPGLVSCCGWCTLEVVLILFNVLNHHFAILVKHMVNWSIFTICYSFAIADSIEDEWLQYVPVQQSR